MARLRTAIETFATVHHPSLAAFGDHVVSMVERAVHGHDGAFVICPIANRIRMAGGTDARAKTDRAGLFVVKLDRVLPCLYGQRAEIRPFADRRHDFHPRLIPKALGARDWERTQE